MPAGSGFHRGWEWEWQANLFKYDGQNKNVNFSENPPNTSGPNMACPDELLRLSDDRAKVLNKIKGLSHWNGGGTVSSEGIMWGWRTLSPKLPLADAKPYGTKNHKKIMVVMTDGENRQQVDVDPAYLSGPSPFWRDPDDGDFSVFYAQWNLFWQEDAKLWRTTPDGGGNNNAVRLDYADLWNHIPAEEVQEDLFNSDAWSGSGQSWRRTAVQAMGRLFEYNDIVRIYVESAQGDTRLRQMCDVAKANDIVIFTIAFQAPSGGQSVMRYCASSDAHYYDVTGLNISDAFSSIARTINQLRLVQ
jgi:hypothetical protein